MDDQLEQPFDKMKQEKKPEEYGVRKLNDLPELPFEKILSYLSLEDQIRARAVSRRWCNVINSFRPRSLCFSKHPRDFIYRKSRLAGGEFVQNFISSPRFLPFFSTFGQSILSNLKHLRLYKIDLNAENSVAFLAETLNSLDQLEEFDFLDPVDFDRENRLRSPLCLDLPMLKKLQLVGMYGIESLTLKAPRLKQLTLVGCFFYPRLNLVHGESVERLITDRASQIDVKNLKNLKYLYCDQCSATDATLPSILEQLKEIHLQSDHNLSKLFEQKKLYGRSVLKIFLCGYLLSDPSDPAIGSLGYQNGTGRIRKEYLPCLIESQSRLAEKIPLLKTLSYSAIAAVAPALELDLLNRFTDLERITVDEPVQNVERFLNLLKNLDKIAKLEFTCDQSQEMFDRLPADQWAVQWLEFDFRPADWRFLFKLKSLVSLSLNFAIDIELVSKILEELPFLVWFDFNYHNMFFLIFINHSINHSKQFTFWFQKRQRLSDKDAAIQFIIEKAQLSKQPTAIV